MPIFLTLKHIIKIYNGGVLLMIKGVDISNQNGNVNMANLINVGVQLVLFRATEGTSGKGSRDEFYHQNIANAKAAGLIAGAYHFAHFYDLAKCNTEIENFKAFIGDTKPDIIALDFELSTSGNMTDLCLHFMDSVAGIAPVIFYVDASKLRDNFDGRIAKYPLWIAEYGVDSPSLTHYSNYAIWQYNEKGQIPGVSDNVDMDYVSDDFFNSIKGGSYTPPVPSQLTIPTSLGAVANIQQFLNSRYGFGLAVDNQYGGQTKAAIVKAFQIELNRAFGCGLAVDGDFGGKTKNALGHIVVKLGSTGIFTKLVQVLLICRGWNLAPYYADADCGKLTADKIGLFQREKGLAADNEAGEETITNLITCSL